MQDGKGYILAAKNRMEPSGIQFIDKSGMIPCMAVLYGLVLRNIPQEIIP